MGSAYAEFMENEKGSISAGKLADFAVLSGDPLRVDPKAIGEITVEMTIVGGRVVFERNGNARSASEAQAVDSESGVRGVES